MKGLYMAAALLLIAFAPSNCQERSSKSIAQAVVAYLEARSK